MSETERARNWAATMAGFPTLSGSARSHDGAANRFGAMAVRDRADREAVEAATLAPGATRALGAGTRARPERPDPLRTCFERDRDRILHATAFRRLAGKTQVFVFPADHQRTRLTHALEVAQVARAVAGALSLNVALTEAIALGHDCGHGPGGHASEDAFTPFLDGGFDHARFGADVALVPLNLTVEVLDGIRNHSWSRPTPSTPEGEVVSFADRIAYVCHDFEDAVRAGIVTHEALPRSVSDGLGTRHSTQLATLISALVEESARSGEVAMPKDVATSLTAFRTFNYEQIYLRPAAVAQADAVIAVLQALVEHLLAHPDQLPEANPEAALVEQVVAYVAGMTDRYAFDLARSAIGWPIERLPRGIDVADSV